jgi:O-glycosyl hydrolase
MLKIKEKRPDAVFEAFSNSAPYYMTYSGCCAGNVKATDDNLNPAYYTDFAQYLVDVCTFYKDSFGIEFKTLEPFNEPVTSYWAANGGQEGCHFSTTAQINFLKILLPILKASGLQTVISASDETSTDQSVTDFKAYAKDAAVLNATGQWNAHSYSANNYSRVALRALSTAYGKPLWMSEVGSGGTGIAGNLSLAQKLMDDIQFMRPEAWIDWQYVEEGNDQWCFVKGNFTTKTYLKVKNYYVRQQFSKYIQPGSHFLSLSTNQALAALDKDNQSLVLVLLNNTDLKAYHQVDLSLFQSIGAEIKATRTSDTENNASVLDFSLANRMLAVTLAPRSVTTLVLPVTLNPFWSNALSTDLNYLIMARPSNVVLKANAGSVVVDTYQSGDSTLLWRLKDTGNGYSITSLSGKTLTDPGSYYLQTSTSGGLPGQTFGIERINDGYFKILSKSTGLSFDLEGGKYTSGTAVGLYAYGTSPDAVNRQWQLLLPPGSDKGTVAGVSNKPLADVAPQVVGSKGELLVRLSSEEVRTMTVYNTSGLRVLEQTLTGPCRIPLKAGMYLVAFRSAGRMIGRVEKVVVY